MILTVFILIVSVANAFSVTGKQITTIHPGKNIQEVTITNSGDSLLFIDLTTTKDQYYTPHNIPFSVSENWKEKFDEYEWQRVDWASTKYSEAILPPQTTETVEFVINVPDGVADGTFYAKLEVKDIGKKEGMIVIRPVYVSQVLCHIENPETAALPGFAYITSLLGLGLAFLILKQREKER